LGEVTGIIRNTAGAVIPNARVSVLGAGALLTTTTNSAGEFTLKPVGFNSNLTFFVTTPTPPCIVPTQAPLDMNSTVVVEKVRAQGVLTTASICPPPPAQGTGGDDARARPLQVDDTIQWEQADGLSISSPGVPNGWNAGKVTDILRFPPGQGFLVASDQGGVWSIAEDGPRTATPLSNTWTSVTMSSLALGTGGPRDVYAATYPFGDSEGGDLWETDTSQASPLMSWAQVSPKPPCGNIFKVLVVAERQFVVLACDTGLYWSTIPAAPSVHGVYNWQQAVPAGYEDQAFTGLAKGPGWTASGPPGIIFASRSNVASTAGYAVFTATLKGGKLALTASAAGPSSSQTWLAACASNPDIVYALGVGLGGALVSTDAGSVWNPVTPPTNWNITDDFTPAGALGVSPDCSTVAMGGETGTFVSFDQGNTWTLLSEPGEYNDLHIDVQALVFDPVVPATLFIGSNGGVASAMGVMNGAMPAYESDWNRELFNLELFQGSPSGSVTGLFGGAAQDNGPLSAVFPNFWQHVIDCPGSAECDGALTLFATPVGLGAGNDEMVAANFFAPGESVESVNGTIPFDAAATIPVNLPCTPCTPYSVGVAAAVRSPGGVVNATGQKMIAVAALDVGAANDIGVYGLFANDDGSNMNWQALSVGANLWSTIGAIAPTYDGGSIYVATSTGTGPGPIFRLDSGAAPGTASSALFPNPPTQLTVNSPCPNCVVTGMYAFNFIQNDPNPLQTPAGSAIAVYNQRFLVYNGTSWNETATPSVGEQLLAVTATDPEHIYVASDVGVFDSHDEGGSWANASTGLPTFVPNVFTGFPVIPQMSHDYLEFVADPAPASDTRLYLATYGRSVWRTSRPVPAPPPQRMQTSVTIAIQTGNDNLESYSELQAVLNTNPPQSICLKPSATSDPSPGGVCANSPSATDMDGNQSWSNGMNVSQTFPLIPTPPATGVVLDGAPMTITLVQHFSFPQTADNWDLQGIQVTGLDAMGMLPALSITNGPINGNNCMARLKDAPNPASVTYGLSANDPSGFNIAHPVPNFGASPLGSCPQ
jgi:hypothetical protein